LPVPAAAAQAEALAKIKEKYQADYAKRSYVDHRALAATLIREGLSTRDDNVMRYVLLREGRDLATTAADAAAACWAIDEMAKAYAVDATELRLAALREATRATDSPARNRILLGHITRRLQEAVVADSYDLATRLHKLASEAATKLKSAAINKALQNQGKD